MTQNFCFVQLAPANYRMEFLNKLPTEFCSFEVKITKTFCKIVCLHIGSISHRKTGFHTIHPLTNRRLSKTKCLFDNPELSLPVVVYWYFPWRHSNWANPTKNLIIILVFKHDSNVWCIQRMERFPSEIKDNFSKILQ